MLCSSVCAHTHTDQINQQLLINFVHWIVKKLSSKLEVSLSDTQQTIVSKIYHKILNIF